MALRGIDLVDVVLQRVDVAGAAVGVLAVGDDVLHQGLAEAWRVLRAPTREPAALRIEGGCAAQLMML
eukprot:7578634-Heterocapsa_arctica.AAC.1